VRILRAALLARQITRLQEAAVQRACVYATGASPVWVQVAYYGPLARCRRFLFDFRVDYAAKVMGNEDSDFYQETCQRTVVPASGTLMHFHSWKIQVLFFSPLDFFN
jgi:hypothetical protein